MDKYDLPADKVTLGPGTAHLAVIQGVCVIAGRGTITLPLYLEAAYRAAVLVDRLDATAYYIGLDRALIAMGEDDFKMGLTMLGPAATARLQLPGALVVSEIASRLAKRHAWNCAKAGIERMAFTESAPAWAWALSRARAVRTQRLEDRLRPGFVPSAQAAL